MPLANPGSTGVVSGPAGGAPRITKPRLPGPRNPLHLSFLTRPVRLALFAQQPQDAGRSFLFQFRPGPEAGTRDVCPTGPADPGNSFL